MLVWNTFLNDARVRNEAESLVRAGYRVTVHALHAPGITARSEVVGSGVQIERLGGRQGKRQLRPVASGLAGQSRFASLGIAAARLTTHLALLRALVRCKPDAIHAHDVNVLPTAWLAARIAGVPLVYDAHEISTHREGYKAFRGLVGWLEKKIMPTAAGTITTTDARAKFFARAYRVPRPLVLQNRPRLICATRSNRIREELRLTQPWPIVLYQGGLQTGRGLPRLVQAAAQVSDAYFVFIGGGRQSAELHALAETLGLRARVHFIPTVLLAELPSYTASADIGVQPIENTCLNHFTTDSNKLFEYVIAGLPVVASRLPEIRKVVEQDDLGLLVTPGDTDSLVDALRRLVADADLRAHYAKNAAQAAQHLNWEAQEAALVELYARVLESR
jgi:glycosyltransferase involved in cell wall biosynthesis